ncbi:MAG TPA: FAD-dependent oxidoreductase [Patescibacteria group bacterium]|nr:FAD-dependent oxidoreductase [Patescibacteria group bacterium]
MKQNQEKQNVVILGGGFAGMRVALDLAHYLDGQEFEIILVDRKGYQTYTSGLYEAATTEHGLVEARKVKRTVAIPFDDVFGHTKVKVFKGYIESVDLENGHIITDSRILPYEYLVVAMGSVSDFYGIPGLDKYSFTLKTLEDAIMIRNRVEEIVTKKDSATIVIGGGGFAGAEFAGELHNLLRKECTHHGKDLQKFRLLVIEGGTSYLPGLPSNVSSQVEARLAAMGVAAKFSTLLTEAGKDFVMLNKTERMDCDLLVWTGGVRACRVPGLDISVACDRKDRVMVMDFLNLKKYPNVFVAGDNACFLDPVTKKPVPQTAQEAIHMGQAVARNVYRSVTAKPLLSYHASPTRFVIPVSGKFAILYTTYLVVGGLAGYAMRRAADLRYFLTILPFAKALKLWLFENQIFVKND